MKEGAASAVASGALSALLQDLVRGADPGSSWERALRPGAVIGRFELIRELGRGGFGIVYEARDRELGRAVALKAVRAGDRLDLREERLLREAEAAARLSHPNIVTLFDVGRCEHGPYLVLELLRGQTLAQRLAQGPVPVRESVRISAAVARGLSHAHAEGVVHRDLTPGNVFLCQDGQVKVLDLGMAHAFGRRGLDGGTPGFMAPEQRRGAPEDERTDVFALGVLLYRLLAGELPFPAEAAHRSRSGRPAPAIEVPEVPGLGPLVGRMLALDPTARPRDAGQVVAALDAFERELGRAPAPGGAQPVVRTPSRRRAVAVIAVAGTLLAIAVAIGVWRAARGPESGHPAAVDARVDASIAVLPFLDLSPGRDQEFFADGVTEEILNALAQVEGLRVTGRTSSFSFKKKNEDLESIARKLRVARLLEGSVRREGSRVRITAQLVDAAGHHLWSETFDRELTGIFAVQEEIARAVVGELKVKLLPGEAPSLQERSTASLDAYREFLLGRQLALQGTRAGYLRAIAAFERAVAADPSYGPAWAGMASALAYASSWSESREEERGYVRRGLEAAEKAISTRARLADGYAARGFLRATALLDWEGAEADLRRALELNPGDAATLRLHGRYILAARGRLEEGIAVLRRSTELDPLHAPAWISLGGASKTIDLRLAHAAIERALELAPANPIAAFHLATVLLLQGRAEEARAAAERIHEAEFFRLVAVALAEHSLGHAAESRRALDELTRRHAALGAYQIACVHAWRGDRERAFHWLDRAYVQHDPGLGELLMEPMLRPLRGDPRFDALLRKMRLPVERAP